MSVKRAHMITRAYLEAWANDRGLVHVADAESKVNRAQTLVNATVVSHAYRTEITPFDIEADYARIESRGIPALRSLVDGGAPNRDGRDAIVKFLDMHLERGRYADQVKVRTPVWMGTVLGAGHQGRMAEMALGDRLTFARDIDSDAVRLAEMGLERWPWRVLAMHGGLITGDGAVMLFEKTEGSPICAITFPLSPTRLLVIGDGLPGIHPMFNMIIAGRCRRWLVDQVDGAMARAITF